MNEYRKKKLRQQTRLLSIRDLRIWMKHKKPFVRGTAVDEYKRRVTIRAMTDTEIMIAGRLDYVDCSTLTADAIEIEVEVSWCEVNSFWIPYIYRAWWYDEKCVAFSYDIPDETPEYETEEWLEVMRNQDVFDGERIDGILDGNRLIIFDTPLEYFNPHDDYQVEFARKESP